MSAEKVLQLIKDFFAAIERIFVALFGKTFAEFFGKKGDETEPQA